jgi:hypothetical protein
MYRSKFFFNKALVGGEWLASRPCRFTPGERVPGTHWIGGWVAPKPVLTTWARENSLPYRNSNSEPLGRPARSQSLYRLRYPGSHYMWMSCPNVDGNIMGLRLSVMPTLEITVPLHPEETERAYGGSKRPEPVYGTANTA